MTKPRIGIIGAGKLGVTLGQLARLAGYEVFIAGSGPIDKINLSMKVLVPGATPVTVTDIDKHADVIILAMPLGKYETLPNNAFHGKIVIDAMNYWWETDGENETLSRPKHSTSELVQAHLSGARVTKAFSHVGYHDLRDFSTLTKTQPAITIAFAGPKNDKTNVEQLIRDFGFDSLYLGDLFNGKKLEPGSPIFGAHLAKKAIIAALDLELIDE